jgi:hypothetical protein
MSIPGEQIVGIHCMDEKDLCRQKIMQMLRKHPDSGDIPNFLMEDGNKCSLHDRGSSILRHAARTFMNPTMKDVESGLPELLHLMSSVAVMYIRTKRGIVHPQDDEQARRRGIK